MIGYIAFDLVVTWLIIGISITLLSILGNYLFEGLTESFSSIPRNYIHLVLLFFSIVFIYAIVTCNLNSIYIFPLILLLYLTIVSFRQSSIRKKIKFIQELKFSLIFFIVFTFLIIIQLFRLNFFDNEKVYLGFNDLNFYSDSAYFMSLFGLESPANWFIYFNRKEVGVEFSANPTPYHYIELWVHSMVSKLSLIKGVVLMNIITIPLLSSFSVLGFVSIGKTLAVKKAFNLTFLLLLSFCFIFFMGVIPMKLGGFPSSIFLYLRTSGMYIFFPLSLLFLIKNRIGEFILLYTLIPFANILYYPTILGSLGIFVLVRFIKNRNLPFNHYWPIIFCCLTIPLFYYVLNQNSNIDSVVKSTSFSIQSDVSEVLHGIFRLTIARIWFFYIPTTIALFLLIYYIKNKTVKIDNRKMEIALLFGSLFTLAIILSNVIKHVESGTIGSIVINPLITISSFIIVVYTLQNRNQLKYMVFSTYLIVIQSITCMYLLIAPTSINIRYKSEPYSVQFIYKSERLLNNLKNKIGVIVKDTTKFNLSFFANSPHTPRHSAFTDFFANGIVQVPISIPKNINNVPFQEIHDYVKNQPFYKFNQHFLKSSSSHSSIEELQLSFIDEFSVEYAIVEPKASIPKDIITDKSIILEDKITHHKLILFDGSENVNNGLNP